MVKMLRNEDIDPEGHLVVGKGSEVGIVLFYSDKSRFSIAMEREYQKFASKCSKCAIFAMNVDGNNIIERSSKFPYTIDVVPLIVLFRRGSPCTVYDGPRTAADLLEFVDTINDRCTL